MNGSLTVEFPVHVRARQRGRKQLRDSVAPPAVKPGRVPRVARLMALALRFDNLVERGAVKDYAELARLGCVSRARLSQIIGLVYLAPDIIDDLLHLPVVEHGRDPLTLRHLLPVTIVIDWTRQRRLWVRLRRDRGITPRSEAVR